LQSNSITTNRLMWAEAIHILF